MQHKSIGRSGGTVAFSATSACCWRTAWPLVLYVLLTMVLPVEKIASVRQLAFICMNLLAALAIRMVYRYAYKCGYQDNWKGKALRLGLKIFSGGRVMAEADPDSQKIKIAIIGAGTVGVSLAEDLWTNPKAKYVPRCFIDSDPGEDRSHNPWRGRHE